MICVGLAEEMHIDFQLSQTTMSRLASHFVHVDALVSIRVSVGGGSKWSCMQLIDRAVFGISWFS